MSDLIQKLGLEKCKAIVDGAPSWADIFCTSLDDYFAAEGGEHGCCISVAEIHTAIANHTDNLSHFDHCSDIRNHVSPNTRVIENE